jgi:hypothetical protein
MASDHKKAKATPVPKKEAAAADKSPAATAPTKATDAAPAKGVDAPAKGADAPAKGADAPAQATDAVPAKTEGSETAAAAPKNYSRGEGQKPVTQAYKDNWNAIFGKDPKKKKKR